MTRFIAFIFTFVLLVVSISAKSILFTSPSVKRFPLATPVEQDQKAVAVIKQIYGEASCCYYAVAWHQKDHVKTVIYSNELAARQGYDLVSRAYAKILWNMNTKSEVKRYGRDKYVNICRTSCTKLTESDQWRASVTAVAWHEKNHVNSISFTTPKIAKVSYDSISRAYAKTLTAAPSYSQFATHGNSKYVHLAQRSVKDMHLTPIYVVAWHTGAGKVRVVAVGDLADARVVYDLISPAYAKCIYNSETSSIVDRYGEQRWVHESVKIAAALSATGQRRYASFCVGFYKDNEPIWDCYSDITSGKTAYHAIDRRFAKVLVSLPSGASITQHGGEASVQRCLDGLPYFLNYYKVVVAFHARGKARTVVYADAACASAAYEVIPPAYAKALVSSARGVLQTYGRSPYVEASILAAEKILYPGRASSQRSPTSLIGWHDHNGVNVVGYADVKGALSAYNSISRSYAKVLVDGVNREELARYGGNKWCDLCIAYINGLTFN